MNIQEKEAKFYEAWNNLVILINNSKYKYYEKPAVRTKDFYFTLAKTTRRINGEYDCIVCYRNWDNEAFPPLKKNRADKTVILQKELLDYYLNGWDKKEELSLLQKIYSENLSDMNYLKKTKYCEADRLNRTNEEISKCLKENSRIFLEGTCVQILLKNMELI